MPRSRYRYLACDLITGRVREKVRLSGVSADIPLDQSSGGQFSASMSVAGLPATLAQSWLDATESGRSSIVVVRDGVALGEWQIDQRPDRPNNGRPVTISGSWITGYFGDVIPVFTNTAGDLPLAAWSNVDQLSIAAALLAQGFDPIPGSLAPAGSRGLACQPVQWTPSGQLVTRTDWPGQWPSVRQMMTDLATSAAPAGFDWTIRVSLGQDAAGNLAVIRTPVLGYPRLGIDAGLVLQPVEGRPGGNTATASIGEDGTRLATQVIGLGAGVGRAQTIATAANSSLVAAYPLRQQTFRDTGNRDPGVVQNHVNAQAALARSSQVPPTLTVYADRDPVLGSYNPGDYFTLALGRSTNFPNGYRQKVRLTNIGLRPPKAGLETVALTLATVQET